MRRRLPVVTVLAALCLAATACGGDGDGVDAIRATASAQLATTTSTTAAPADTTTTSPAETTTTTVRPSTTTTTRPRATTTTAPRPTTTAPTIPPTTRAPGDTRRAVAWERYAVSGDGRTLTFTYWSGPPPCSIDAGIDVEETATAVRVTIFERDGSGGQPCIAIAQQKSATVTLASPLGSRQVVDGARA